MKKKRKVLLAGILLVVLTVLASVPFVYWHKTGIRNKIYDLLKIEYTEYFGYYNQVIPVKADMTESVPVTCSTDTENNITTNIPKREGKVEASLEIDRQITAELESGNYTWESPMAILDPYQISPLTGVILFETEEPCAVRVTVKGKTEAADISGELEIATKHRVPVVGLYPETENTVVLELLDEKGKVTDSQEIMMQTEGVPNKLVNAVEPVTVSGQTAYQLTVVYGEGYKLPFAFDCNGDMRWYLSKTTGTYGLYMLSNNHFLTESNSSYAYTRSKPQPIDFFEMDMLGRVYHQYIVPNGAHHEIIEMEPGGNLLCATSSLENHVEEAVVEIDRTTGAVVNYLDMAEVFAPTYVDKVDWAHVNTVSYQSNDDTVLISCRNLHSVIKLKWSTHEIVWILSDPKFWKDTPFESYVLEPQGDIIWQYQQHSAYQLAADLDGNPDTVEISLFDNHSATKRKIDFFDERTDSFLSVYSVDEAAKTVSMVKNIPVVYSELTSNTVYDEESGHIFGMCGWMRNNDAKRYGTIYEYDYKTGELVNQYSIKNRFYRANQLKLDFADLSSAMEETENEMIGALRPAVKTKKWIFPARKLIGDKVELTILGDVLYFKTADHHTSQILFKGKKNNYVYDLTTNMIRTDKYLEYVSNVPVPLTNMEPDTYAIYCVFENDYYKFPDTVTIS